MKKIISVLLVLMLTLTSMVCVVSADEKEAFDTVELKQFDVLPDIDGSISNTEWGQPVATAKFTPDTTSCYVHNVDTTMQFEVWMGYTFEGLYLAVKNKDDSHFNANSASKIYDGDCMQLRIDEKGCTVDQGIIPEQTRNKNWSDKYSEFGFALGNDGTIHSQSWAGVAKGQALDSGSGKYVIVNDGNYTTYELFIPWENIVEEAPHVGTRYGMTIGMMDWSKKTQAFTNWLEWGSGEFNGRGDNYCGSNRIIFTDETLRGGAPLEDPNPVDSDQLTQPIIPDATGDYILIDPADYDISNTQGMFHEVNGDTKSTDFFYEARSDSDWYVTYKISQKVKAQAEDYKYLAIFLKSNTTLNTSRIYYTTSVNNQVSQENSMEFFMDATDENQIVFIDMTLTGGWEGRIGSIRLDYVNPEGDTAVTGSSDEFVTSIYGIALFKNENDARVFKVSEVDVSRPEVTTVEITDPADDTEAPDDDTTKNEGSDKDTTKAPTVTTTDDGTESDGNSLLWLWIVLGVVAVAAIGAGVFFFIKKKKA